MRILIINQFFWPDVAPTGQYLCDLARYLSGLGHDVTVLCSDGLYGEERYDEDNPPPVKIIRVPGLRYKRGALARLVSYTTFFTGVLWHEFRVPRQDIVVTMTTPPLLSIAGTIMKFVLGTKHYIWEMDVFPDALVALGALKKQAIVTRVLASIQNFSRRRSDGIVTLGPCMRDRLLANGTPAELLHIADNWADGSAIAPEPPRRFGPLNVLYSGNLGMAHELETITGTIRHFQNDQRFLFTFAGGGVGRTLLKKLCTAEDIRNVRFLPYAERSRISEHLAQADIGLVTELNSCVGTVVPSKVYGLMAAGRPLLFIGPAQATPSHIIQRFECGWQIDPGDVLRLNRLLERLSLTREEVWTRGHQARLAFDENYDLPVGVARVAAALGLGQTARAESPGLLVSSPSL